MYCYKFPRDINKLLDGRTIIYTAPEVGMFRERLSKILRGLELCTESEAERLVKRVKPNEKMTDYFKLMNNKEVNEFYGERDM